MKRSWPLLTAVFVSALGAVNSWGGTITYVAIPSAQSDSNCGISRDYGYTTAVDGGNTRGTDRALNGITLYSLSGAGQNSATADNCTLNALSGTLTDGGLTSKNIAADGTVRDFLSDMVFNNAGGDNSQVEIVLDPESLEEGSTYDLRVYVCSSSGQNRQVNLAFFGDGQNAAETGFFNEDDARTSAGGFQSANQVYYIDYRYTWDGDSTPGITITQKFGGAPFCLYALTNELVEGEANAGAGGGAGTAPAAGGAGGGGGEAAAGEGEGDDGLSSGLVDQESDEVGVESDDFYSSESLNSHGRWVKLSKWGTCWQPTDVASGWAPYTNGSWKDCDDCGWTFVSDEPWAWACYHYGRWCKVSIGCGWAWVPGKVWAPSWVSWRREREGSSCGCIGWAPLPPEAGCQVDVGISSWVDATCNIGPECYTFINIRDFGLDNYWGCNCIYERNRNTTIIIDTFNCTNICYGRHVNIYCGGPDYNWCNTRIRQLGGKECGKVYVNRYDNPGKLGGKFAKHDGNQLGLVSPKIRGTEHPKFRPKIAESAGADKIDHGWKGLNKKDQQQVRNHIAQETKGKNPRNSPAKLPEGVAEKMKQHGGRKAVNAGQAGQGAQGGQAGGNGLRPGGKRRQGQDQGIQGQGLQAGGQGQGGAAGGGDQHPGKRRGKGQGQVAGGTGAGTGATGQGGGADQHPGKNRGRGQGRAGAAGAGALAGGNQQGVNQGAGTVGPRHPGQSLKKQKGGQGGAGAGSAVTEGTGGGAAGGGGGQHPGRRKGQGAAAGQAGSQAAGGGTQAGGEAATGGQGQGAGGRGKGKRRQQQQQGVTGAKAQGGGQQLQPQTQGQEGQGGGAAGGGGGGKGKRRQQQGGAQGQVSGQGGGGGGTGAGGGGRHRQQTTSQQGAGGQGQAQGGGGGGQGHRRQQQQQQQQLQQQQAQQRQLQQQQLQQQRQQQRQQQGGGGGGGGGGGKRRRPTPTPAPR